MSIHIAGPYNHSTLTQYCRRCGEPLFEMRFAHRWRKMPWPEGARVEVTENYTSMRLDRVEATCEDANTEAS